MRALRASILVFPLLLLGGGCETNETNAPAGINPDSSVGPAAGQLGGACNVDGDCTNGMVCVQGSGYRGTDKYCAPRCTAIKDCMPLAKTSYVIGPVPTTFTPFLGEPTKSAFGTDALSRGVACAPRTEGGSENVCMFACSHNEALVLDDKGEFKGCYCLPGYKLTASKDACVFDNSHCSIFSYADKASREELKSKWNIDVYSTPCNACNSDMSAADSLGCHTGAFFCNINDTQLNGTCTEYFTVAQLDACIKSKTSFDCACDSGCLDSCRESLGCADICCKCKEASSPKRPVCDDDAGVADTSVPDTGADTSVGDTGTTDTGTTPDTGICTTPGTLHKTVPGSFYCPFVSPAGTYCTSQTQHCCQPSMGSSSCDPIATPCAATETDWRCADATHCPSGQKCCGIGTFVKNPDPMCANYATGFKGTKCATSCAATEIEMCSGTGGCSAGTCTPFTTRASQVGACR